MDKRIYKKDVKFWAVFGSRGFYRMVRRLWIIRRPLETSGNRPRRFWQVSSRFPDNPSLTDHTVDTFGFQHCCWVASFGPDLYLAYNIFTDRNFVTNYLQVVIYLALLVD